MSSEQTTPPHVRLEMLKSVKASSGLIVVYLTNGIKLTGKLLDFDSESLLLDHKDVPNGMVVELKAIASMRREAQEGGKMR